jgi:serine/threonine-protein kinase
VSAIGHPSVVKVLEVARDAESNLFMVLELLEGDALFYAIQEGTLSLGDILEIGRQLLDALGAAHERGIVHRDVKPENIFLVREPDAAIRVKLIDFGIAKILRRDHATTFSTMDGLVVGTPHYMSPQMCAGEPANEGADVWAAGAVLFHALAGEPPFDDANLGRLLLKIVRDRAPSIGRFRPDIPEDVIKAVDKALHPDPRQRWKNAREFHRALVAASAPLLDLDPEEIELEE